MTQGNAIGMRVKILEPPSLLKAHIVLGAVERRLAVVKVSYVGLCEAFYA